MGLNAHFLGDTSAVARVVKPAVAPRLRPLMEAGLVARCTITDLEAGVSARNGSDWQRTRMARSPWPLVTIDQAVLDRAFEVQGELAGHGLHRAVKIGDLIIAEVTGQPVDWVVASGTAD